MRRPAQSLAMGSYKKHIHTLRKFLYVYVIMKMFFLVSLHKFRFSGFHFKFSFIWCTRVILTGGGSRQIFILTERGKLQEAHFVNF
jgi:hypothetical protein